MGNAETEFIADEADAKSEAVENAETESIADEADAESEAEENAETESIADAADAESEAEEEQSEEAEEVASEAEEVDSEAEDDAESEAEIAIEVSKPVDDKPDAKTLEQRRRRDLEAGWVGIGSVKDCYPLSPVAYNSVVRTCSTGMRKSQRVAKKIHHKPLDRQDFSQRKHFSQGTNLVALS